MSKRSTNLLQILWTLKNLKLPDKFLENRSNTKKRTTVAFAEYERLLRKARWLLREYDDAILLADRAFACHDLMAWLKLTDWHYALRLKCDVLVHGVNRHPIEVGKLYPPMNQAKLLARAFRGKLPPKTSLTNVGLWADGIHHANLVLATVSGAKDAWAVITDEVPSLQTLWNYSSRFCVEELSFFINCRNPLALTYLLQSPVSLVEQQQLN